MRKPVLHRLRANNSFIDDADVQKKDHAKKQKCQKQHGYVCLRFLFTLKMHAIFSSNVVRRKPAQGNHIF